MYKFNPQRIQVGISACLLGQQVRFDGGHKRSSYCDNELGKQFDFVEICPEMAIGLGAPRQSLRLVRDRGEIRIRNANMDVTDKLRDFSERQVERLNFISGYILCGKSPSCGMERVKVYKADTNQGAKEGTGIFAAALKARWPQLPIEEEGRLHDPLLRENFITRVFAFHKWQCLQAEGMTRAALMAFHARYKYLLLAHNPAIYRQLGPMLAHSDLPLPALAEAYLQGFMAALAQPASRRNHSCALEHIQGYFKHRLDGEEKQELCEAISAYRLGMQPLLVPLTLIKHHLRQHPDDYIASQVYLNPHPQELKLRYGL
ncbi:DUF1722 domain-containing protein [Shewanella cyperi]|uniref:DUF1722 domain-containing protein n=1 Tax=Shewanella cyperi TaxID=2814292 RepID=A0A974XJ12_9GAMM|nr:DUF523 and DUF1722 domain-containing protein [Shewanella cyperi]QSX29275.1 DUF1722 domain-containing protein [Shewanella cyperi]